MPKAAKAKVPAQEPLLDITDEQLNRRNYEEQMEDALGVEDLNLPKSMVQRLAKGVLSPNTILQKEAVLAYTKSATVFINYIASSANDHAVLAGKKTIQPADVFKALKELEFEAFLPRCEAELEKYNAVLCEKRNTYRQRIREAQKVQPDRTEDGANGDVSIAEPASSPATVNVSKANGTSKRQSDEPPSAKRARMSNGTAQDPDEESEGDFEDAQEQPDDDASDADEANDGTVDDEDDEDEIVEDALEEPADDSDHDSAIDDDDHDDNDDDDDE